MKRTDFHYELPEELIAQEAKPRGDSRMLLLDPAAESIEHRTISDLPRLLQPGDLVVLNDTRVIPARLFADPKPGMTRRIEIMLARRLEGGRWQALAKPAKRLRPGDELTISSRLSARILEKGERGSVTVELFDPATGDNDVAAEIDRVGRAPLPPYIRRDATEEDRERYQTIYADEAGAVAAPTAGLHLSRDLLEEIRERGVSIARVTLHVGLGTFRPVEVEQIADHEMETEFYRVPEATARAIETARERGGRIVAIGTTTVRTLESASDEEGNVRPGEAETDIFITPGYQFRVVDALLTNFHLPESTLLMLVSAFAGHELTLRAYAEAVSERYRFFSYGDAMFISSRCS